MNLREKALALRAKKKSYNEICSRLHVAKSTLAYWLRNNTQSKSIQKELIEKAQRKAIIRLRKLAKQNKKKWDLLHASFKKEASEEFPKLEKNPYFIPGIMLYWGEGDKKIKNGIIRMPNVDFRLLRVFINFLTKCCGYKKSEIKSWILLYPDLKEKTCKEFWSKMLHLPSKNFLSSQYSYRGTKRSKVKYGICTVQAYNKKLKQKILTWIDVYAQKYAGVV